MKRFIVYPLALLILGALTFIALTSGLLSPGGIPGNTRYPEMEFRAEKALAYAQKKGLEVVLIKQQH